MRSGQLAGKKDVTLNGEGFVWEGSINVDRLVINNPPGDALVLASGATGRIGYVEIHTTKTDGIKVQNADANAAHDCVIESGLLRATARAADAHQDGVQVMGGKNLTFRKLSIFGFYTQGFFCNRAGGGATTPTNITLEDSYIGSSGATAVMIENVTGMVIRRNHIWKTERFGRGLIGAPNDGTNTIHEKGDAFPMDGSPPLGGVTPPPPPPPPPDPDEPPAPPPTDPCAAVKAELAALKKVMAEIHTLST